MNKKALANKRRKYAGITCPDPKCGAPCYILHTYHFAGGAQIHRRRQCRNGHRISTMERIFNVGS